MSARGRAAPLLLAAIGIAGAAISIYLLAVHYSGAPLVCATSGIVNCERVLASPYSSVAGVPISAAGLLWFVVVVGLAVLALVRTPEPRWLQPLQVLWSFIGLASVLYLVAVEVLALGVLCAWCTSLHVLILGALFVSILRTPATQS